ncbi:MAG TPA: sugar phosphate isomerase/epimerase family protein [Actinomycetota bacterium]|nr:sugar phosphate isomerase/epimerase family protein [Actinomycetota bacterium]
MRRLGLHAMVWVGGWSPEECRYAAAKTAEAGYGLIEIPALEPESMDAGETRKALEEHGLQAACSLGLTLETDVSSADPATVRRGEERLASALEFASSVGATHLTGVLYGALTKYPAPAAEKNRANSVSAIRRLADAARPAGVEVCLEAVNRYETNLMNTAEEAMAFLEEVGSDNVYVHLDTYHMNIEERSMRDAVLRCGDRLGYLHVGESHRGYLGTGSVNFDDLFAVVAETGYDGPIAFESFSSAVVSPLLSNTLAVWRNLWDDGMDLAVSARKFVEEGLGSAAT